MTPSHGRIGRKRAVQAGRPYEALWRCAGRCEPEVASFGVGRFGQEADAVGEIACTESGQLLYIGDGQGHRFAQQVFAVSRRTARTTSTATTYGTVSIILD